MSCIYINYLFDQVFQYIDFKITIFAIIASVLSLFLLGLSGGFKKTHADRLVIRPVWTAYVTPIFYLNAWLAVQSAAFSFQPTARLLLQISNLVNIDLAYLKTLLVLSIIAIQGVSIFQVWKKYMLIDEEGVWGFQGILPWTVTCEGLTWKNFERAWSSQSFISWALSSWTVRIYHRYNSDERFEMDHMPNGTAGAINEMSQRFQN